MSSSQPRGGRDHLGEQGRDGPQFVTEGLRFIGPGKRRRHAVGVGLGSVVKFFLGRGVRQTFQLPTALKIVPSIGHPGGQPFRDVSPLGDRGICPPRIGKADDPNPGAGLQTRQEGFDSLDVAFPLRVVIGHHDHFTIRQRLSIGLMRGLGTVGTRGHNNPEIPGQVGGLLPFGQIDPRGVGHFRQAIESQGAGRVADNPPLGGRVDGPIAFVEAPVFRVCEIDSVDKTRKDSEPSARW